MARRCSHCSNNGHNSRTCPTRASTGALAAANTSSSTTSSSASSSSVPGVVKLFGVRLTDGSIMKKSASMGNLSAVLAQAHHYNSSPSPNPGSPSSDHVRDSSHGNDGYASDDPAHGSSSSSNRRGETKKGVPWTEEEHRMFLIGLQKLGKGDWRGIARNFVVSRTPTQVASHAQKYFIRQNNASRRKRRSSLFDMVPDTGTEPQELPPLQARESDIADALPSLNLALKPEFEPMDTASPEPAKEPNETPMESSESSPTVPRPSEVTPVVSGSSEFTPFVPGFFPAYVPVPYTFWSPNAAPFEEGKAVETSHHQVLKPLAILPKEPVNVDELVGMSQLNLEETNRLHREPSPLSLKLIGDSSRQSAFHANASASGSDLSKGKGSPIRAV